VSALPQVEHVTSVLSGTAWLTASFAATGSQVDAPPAGLAIPLEVAGVDVRSFSWFLSQAQREVVGHADGRWGALGASSARFRRLGPGARLAFGSSSVRIVGVVPDASIGAHELVVSKETARTLGIHRDSYMLIRVVPGTSKSRLQRELATLLPEGALLRVRERGETPFLRQADAVLPLIRIKELAGEFAARLLDGGLVEPDPAWVAAHIVSARVPLLGTVRCNRALIPLLQGAMAEVAEDGLSGAIDPSDFGGCFVSRFIRRDSSAGLSRHSWGAALDINVSTNEVGGRPHMDPRVVAIFERWGFTWGGRWLLPDGMHFELFDAARA
jgi:hypothetical protein